MEQDDGQVPAPRRPGGRRRPAPQPEPRVADLSALLADIDALRTTLSTDLSLAAAALEAGADDLAAEVIGTDVDEVRAFEQRALRHLAALDGAAPVEAGAAGVAAAGVAAAGVGAAELFAPAGSAAVDVPEVAEVVVPLRRRRRVLTAAAPLVAAAAAVVALLGAAVPSSTPVPTEPAALDGLSQAGFSLATLSELAEQGATPGELRAAALELNAEVADLVADNDPLAARQALLLLQAGTLVLNDQDDQGALRDVLARTRELERALRRVLPAGTSTVLPLPSLPPVVVPEREPSSQPSPRQTRPASSPTPTTSTAPRPSSSPAKPSSAPQPSSSPTPAPSATPGAGDPFPRPVLPSY